VGGLRLFIEAETADSSLEWEVVAFVLSIRFGELGPDRL
jgi:hypothetical protein